MWYVRDANFKLNQAGEIYDMSHAPFTETLIEADKETGDDDAARVRLKAALKNGTPPGGILDQGDGSVR